MKPRRTKTRTTRAQATRGPDDGDRKVGEGRIRTQPGPFTLAGEVLTVGRDTGEPVTDGYPGTAPRAFSGGTLHRGAVDVSGEPYVDLAAGARAMLARE